MKIFMDSTQKRKWSSWKTPLRYAKFVNDEENGCRSDGQRKETKEACLVNSCQRQGAGVLFRPNYSFHPHTSIGCDTST